MVRDTNHAVQPAPRGSYAKSVHPDALTLQVGDLSFEADPPPATPDDGPGVIALDDRRPDPHARRTGVRHSFPATPTPVVVDPVAGQTFEPDPYIEAGWEPIPDAATSTRPDAGGLVGRINDALEVGMLAAECGMAADDDAAAHAIDEYMAARDWTAAEAAAVLADERPGLSFSLIETAIERRGVPAAASRGPDSARTCSAVVYGPGGVRRAYTGGDWRGVVRDMLAANPATAR